MAIKTQSELQTQAIEIRDETTTGANTALRVGTMNLDEVDTLFGITKKAVNLGDVTGSVELDLAFTEIELNMTGDTTISFTNLSKNRDFILIVTGNHTLTLPANFKASTNSADFDGTITNIFTCIVRNDTSGSEVIAYTLETVNEA